MTIETLADMIWALGYAIKIVIYDPAKTTENHALADFDVPARTDTKTQWKAITVEPPTTSRFTVSLPAQGINIPKAA